MEFIMKNLICLDASIQSTGVSIYDYESKETYLYSYTNKIKKDLKFSCGNFKINIIKQDKEYEKKEDFVRYMHVTETIFNEIEPYLSQDSIIYLEGYAYASKGLVFNIGEFCALLKYPITVRGYEIKVVPPSHWKKAIIGNGSAKKEMIYSHMLTTELREVLAEFVAKGYPYKKGSWVEDIADVYAIQKYVLSI